MEYLFENKTQNLVLKQNLVDDFVKKKILNEISLKNKHMQPNENLEKKTVLLDIDYFLQNTKFLRLWGIRTLIKNSFARDEIDPIFKKILEKTKSKIKEWDGEMYFIYLPEKERYRNKFHYYISKDNFRNKKNIINIVKDLDIKIIDMDHKVFRKKNEPLVLFNDHYSTEGYELIVEEILKIN